jgi:hypothetical protein
MALSKIFKKTNVPDELPDLAIDELKKDLKKDYSEKEEKKEEVKPEGETKKEEIKEEENPRKEEIKREEDNSESNEKSPEEISEPKEKEEIENQKNKEKSIDNKANFEKSFFNPLLDELKKENFDPAKINSWYQQRFSDKGAIDEMKEYWEKQKDEFITETIEKEFKERINERMNNLQKLEAEWQEIYINLIQKEEEMKKEEKNIKKIIKDFSEVFKKKGNLKKEPKAK